MDHPTLEQACSTTTENLTDDDGARLVGHLSTDAFEKFDVAYNGRHSELEHTSSSSGASAMSSGSYTDDDLGNLKLDPEKLPRTKLDSQHHNADGHAISIEPLKIEPSLADHGHHVRKRSIPIKLEETGERGRYLLKADEPEIREILRLGIQREIEGQNKKRRSRFGDLVFTRQFSAFDRQNPDTAASPFHGFFTLFWLGVFFMLVKVAANNWKIYGSIFGKNEILSMMFHKDIVILGLTDLLLCTSTAFCLLLQKLVLAGYLSWNRGGWIIQNVCRSLSYTACTPPFPNMVPQSTGISLGLRSSRLSRSLPSNVHHRQDLH